MLIVVTTRRTYPKFVVNAALCVRLSNTLTVYKLPRYKRSNFQSKNGVNSRTMLHRVMSKAGPFNYAAFLDNLYVAFCCCCSYFSFFLAVALTM